MTQRALVLIKLLNLGLTISSIIWATYVTRKWIASEKQISFVEGELKIYKDFNTESVVAMAKW